ncbi:hypothetical protein V4F39_26225 [Aquincola sp. MAHUQ-54]|uniref:Uncharacterized protein n=1 Tax=Aquincola agrisoli TaxID=3119538 RepID=A0AAW9QJM1_9BURK
MTPRLRRAAGWAVAAAVLAAVFMAYLQPTLMRDLADQLWSCF